jgi:hypothetical protein
MVLLVYVEGRISNELLKWFYTGIIAFKSVDYK